MASGAAARIVSRITCNRGRSYIGYSLGGWDGFLYALVAFVVIDYLTGIMVAILEKKLSSDVGFRGIFKKVLIFSLVAIAHIIDSQIIKNGSAIRTAVIFFYLYGRKREVHRRCPLSKDLYR